MSIIQDKLIQASTVGGAAIATVNTITLNTYIETIVLLVSLAFMLERYIDYRRDRRKPKPPKA
uniref:hypothetical protein n=1 Tax=Roseivirga sp. TaxID=1964215 RepID=UPI0040486CA9